MLFHMYQVFSTLQGHLQFFVHFFFTFMEHFFIFHPISFSKSGKKWAQKVWKKITPAYLEKLYESLPRRMVAVVAQGGGHTKY